MKFERLVIEAGDQTFSLDLHPSLTVIAGVSQIERDGLVTELVGALGTGRNGVHVEITSDSGKRFAIFRPSGARHRVVDVDAARDVTAEFCDDDQIDLLARAGLTVREAKDAMRFGPGDLLTTRDRDRLVGELATVNQNELWVAAEALRQSERRLDDEAQALGSSAEDGEVIERIEARHEEFERSQLRLEKWRKTTFLLSGCSAIGVIPAVMTLGIFAAVPLIAIAALATALSVRMWRRNEHAQGQEEDALAEAGAQSYLGFHLQRVNGLLSSDQARKRMMQASEERREAQRRWSVIAGEVDLSWALANQTAIAAAVKLRQDVVSLGMLPSGSDDVEGERTTALAQAIVSRLNDLRTLGPGNESFPTILDEPFGSVESSVVPSLLELLVRSSSHQQVLLLTNDDAITQWARLEAMTGALSIVEPSKVTRSNSTTSQSLTGAG